MLLRPHLVALICLILAISGCATGPKEEALEPVLPPENPMILQAQLDLDKAKSLLAEWNVRLNPGDVETISLTRILEMAKQAQETGNTDRATDLAQKVIQFARLGIEQAEEQQNTTPFYPQ